MKVDVYLEVGKKRTFAAAMDWPGWCRSGGEEREALEALVTAAPRYRSSLRGTMLGFRVPPDASVFTILERLPGDASTDFGAPGASPTADQEPVTDQDLQRFRTVLRATWRSFDRAVEEAVGKELPKGPRGGGRSLQGIVHHVIDGDVGYLNALGWKHRRAADADLTEELARGRKAILDGLEASARGDIPRRGPRGGVRWWPRYFVRRVAWHALDHAWEIEDRAV